MTYRNNGSYLVFRGAGKLGRNISSSSRMMDQLIEQDKTSHHLNDIPVVTKSQNAFEETNLR